MDLDKIKDIWKNTEISPSLNDENISRILNNKGKGALNRLLSYERLSMCLLPFCMLLPFIHNKIFADIAPFPLVSIVLFILFCSIGTFWQYYKVKLLKKINPNDMNIIEASKYITLYKKYINYELSIGIIWILTVISTYTYSLLHLFVDKVLPLFIIFVLAEVIVAILFVYFFYRWMYTKNIRSIEHSIKEIEDFEKDNH
ncbi:hypothetical protein D0T53_06080 [Dysgonomonas sp. 216]|uniref:hypothetical protein n=1 Tax=Dysgonomonas sp. 216 TaxID=2302934 RepID=UPI0013D63824|nr:hypothetical protein [Dysgonomonas sp. 216]NDW18482.1 hypothetical protein [Dysgonomonas sp. 216]